MRIAGAAVLVVGALLVPAASAGSVIEGDCPARQVIVYFWPRGHGAIRALDSPVYRVPHVEVAGVGYGVALLLHPNDKRGSHVLTLHCTRRAPTSQFRTVAMRTITAAMIVTCSTRSDRAHVQLARMSRGRERLRVFGARNTLVVEARLARSSSLLSFSSRRCRTEKPPK